MGTKKYKFFAIFPNGIENTLLNGDDIIVYHIRFFKIYPIRQSIAMAAQKVTDVTI
jgi:hypothetical protein